MAPMHLIDRALSLLLGNEYRTALMGDLLEERARRADVDGPHSATKWYRREVRRSIGAAVYSRLSETTRPASWGIAIGAYVFVAILEIAMRLLLLRVSPDAAQPVSALRLVIEFPGIALISYVAARFDRRAPLLLGTMMLVAISMTTLTTESVSTAFVVAYLTVGPSAVVLGALLARARRTAG